MRKVERLDKFYDELKEIHKKSFPDMRFGQLMMNFLGFVNSTKKRDPFFPEEDEMVELFKEYANSNSMWYQGWDLVNKEFFIRFGGLIGEVINRTYIQQIRKIPF